MNSTVTSRSIPVARPSFGPEEETAVLEVIRSGWVSQGPKVAEFEKCFAQYVGAEHAVAVSSCTTALHLALVAAGVKAGDEVLCPSLSFIATANAIAYVGATPVFVDIDPLTYNMDPNCIERAITPRTRAILMVHQIGLPCAIDEISAIASRHGLLVLEDAACAIGSEYKGQRIGGPHSLMACFSFHPRKILSTGEGGMITTAGGDIAARLRRLRQHAMSVSDLARHNSSTVITESYGEIGFNFRMTDMQAALGIVQLQKLPGFLQRRRVRAANYTTSLLKVPFFVTPQEPTGCVTNFQSYMVRIREGAPIGRDELMKSLWGRGINTRRGVMPIHREQPYVDPKWDAHLPETNNAADQTIILPLYDQMTDEDQDYILDNILENCTS